jgi:ABC-type nitrate/sulfonate/bicarbonate transport system permease component
MILQHVLRSVTGLRTKCHWALAGVIAAEMFGSQTILLYRTVKVC